MDTNGKRPKRPRDMNQLAKRVGDIATGQAEEEFEPVTDPKATARGDARAKNLTPERRAEIARTAAEARWKKKE